MTFEALLDGLKASALRAGTVSSDYDLNPEVTLPATRTLRPAAVMIGVQDSPVGAHILLTKRPSTMRHHPGQIAFPGGKQDKTDSNLAQTALREAFEEVGTDPNTAQFLGALPSHETVTGFNVQPNLFALPRSFTPVPNEDEVAEAFWVPASFLLQPSNFLIQSRRWRGARRYYYAIPYGPYYIWGATARMLFALAKAYHT